MIVYFDLLIFRIERLHDCIVMSWVQLGRGLRVNLHTIYYLNYRY